MTSPDDGWSALWARLAEDGRLAQQGRARLRRQIRARMHARGLRSCREYMRLLDAEPGEYAALASAIRSVRRVGLELKGWCRSAARRPSPGAERCRRFIAAQAKQEQLQRDLVDLVLHDLRGPLATALLGIDAIEGGLTQASPDRAQKSLAMTSAALRRMQRLVDSLLDISHLEAGQSMLRAGEFDVVELLAEVAAEVGPGLATRQLDLQLDLPPAHPVIMADRDMLFRLVINLLDNAIKFSPAGGSVRVAVWHEGDGLAISISDQGPGVPYELQSRVFDKFVGLSLPEAPRGYGLGLSFCKLAAEAHGGRITLASEPGRGSTFVVWLPAQPAAVTAR